jgi:hypothetical protein
MNPSTFTDPSSSSYSKQLFTPTKCNHEYYFLAGLSSTFSPKVEKSSQTENSFFFRKWGIFFKLETRVKNENYLVPTTPDVKNLHIQKLI